MIICELDLLLFFIFGNQIHFVKRAILLIIDLLLYCPLVEIKLLLWKLILDRHIVQCNMF